MKLRDLFNKGPNRTIRAMGQNKSSYNNQKGKESEIIEGTKILRNYKNNLKNWGFCKLKPKRNML